LALDVVLGLLRSGSGPRESPQVGLGLFTCFGMSQSEENVGDDRSIEIDDGLFFIVSLGRKTTSGLVNRQFLDLRVLAARITFLIRLPSLIPFHCHNDDGCSPSMLKLINAPTPVTFIQS
jgi:hypothetical protein